MVLLSSYRVHYDSGPPRGHWQSSVRIVPRCTDYPERGCYIHGVEEWAHSLTVQGALVDPPRGHEHPGAGHMGAWAS